MPRLSRRLGRPSGRRPSSSPVRGLRRIVATGPVAFALLPTGAIAQEAAGPADATTLESIQVSGNWLGSGLANNVRTFAGARTVVDRAGIEDSGATSIGDVLRRVPGVQATDNSGTAGSAISLNIGVRGLTGRYSPRSTVLLDGIPLAVAPYGQPQLSFAPIDLANIESIDVVRGGGSVRYGPQNVGGIINFTTRGIPTGPGLTGDVTVRGNQYTTGGGANAQYSAFLGTQLDNGFGAALLYSGTVGRDWRDGSDERIVDVAVKVRYELAPGSELFGRAAYYEIKSKIPGGLTPAQYNADPFQDTRPSDFWNGTREAFDLGYLNAMSSTREFEIRSYYNQSFRQSALINAARTQLAYQPRYYRVLGIEPRVTQRVALGPTTQDFTVGYRYLMERGSDNSFNQFVSNGTKTAVARFGNSTDAHSFYIDDKIAIERLRITPGVRFERIASDRVDSSANRTFDVRNTKWLPSVDVAYLLTREATLFADYNTSFGPVQNTQLNSQTPANPLVPELARTFEVGARWTSAAVTAELTAFHIHFDNQIQSVPLVTPALFLNVGATRHEGIESALSYRFERDTPLAGVELYGTYTYTRALQLSGATAGLDLPFYARTTDTVGARYAIGPWVFNASSTHQTGQFADNANTFAEPADGTNGRIPGFRVLNLQASWKMPGAKGVDVDVGINNVADRRYYTRNVDSNPGRMVGAPRTVYAMGRYTF